MTILRGDTLMPLSETREADDLAARVHTLAPATLREPPEAPADVPLSSDQLRLWFLDQYEGAGAAYLLNCAWRVRGEIDGSRLERALGRLVERHELLRAVVRPTQDAAVLAVQPTPPAVLSLEASTDPSGLWSAQELDARCVQLAGTALSLATGPVFTAHLLRQDAKSAVLMLRVHHLVADGWSLGVLARDLGALYAADGSDAELPALPLSAARAAQVVAGLRSRRSAQAGAEYWREALRGAPEAIDLPYDFSRPAERSYAGGRCRLPLPAVLLGDLRRIAARNRATVFSVLNAALCGFLGRLADSEDVVIGIGSADRPDRRLEHAVGFYIHTLPLRLDLSGDPSLAELAGRARAALFAGLGHRHIPFDRIVQAVRPERVPGRNPVFQVFCTMENLAGAQLSLPGAVVESYEADGEVSAFDLGLNFELSTDHPSLILDYSTELFTTETAQRLAERFAGFLGFWAARPDLGLGAVPLLDDAEERAVLDGAEAGRSPVRGDLLDDILDALAADPDRVVLGSGDRRLTAAQVTAQVARLSGRLVAAVGKAGRIGVMLPRGTNSVVVVLAALAGGVSYVPLDRRLPIERLRLIAAQARLAGVLWDDSAGPAPQLGIPVLGISEGAEEPGGAAPPERADPAAADDDTEAYVMFTSGSSGAPKGVSVGRRSLTNLVREAVRVFGVRRDDLMLACTTTTFDISLLEMLVPLAAGAACEVADDEANQDVTLLASRAARAGATVLQATPSVWRVLLDQPALRLRAALVGGEVLPEDVKDRLLSAADEVYNCYGPTETTIWSSVWRAQPGPVTVGAALANNEFYVLDRWGRPVPPGCRGELHIAGAALAHGYIGQPALTAEAFITRDLGRGPVRLYRTGDVASWRADGLLRVHGRRDSQVKLRGHRIELGEIEAAIRRWPAAAQCAVVPLDREGRTTGLAAFVVPRQDGEAPDQAALRAHLEAILPGYMVPALFLTAAAIPRLPSGKTDTRALGKLLAAHVADDHVAEAPGAQPGTAVEGMVASIFQTVLDCPPSMDASFFDQGGDSIGAARVVAAVRSHLKAEGRGAGLRLADFLTMPTVRTLSGWIERTVRG